MPHRPLFRFFVLSDVLRAEDIIGFQVPRTSCPEPELRLRFLGTNELHFCNTITYDVNGTWYDTVVYLF